MVGGVDRDLARLLRLVLVVSRRAFWAGVGQRKGRWNTSPILRLGVFLPLSILMFTTCTITSSSLRIRSGFFKWEIPIQNITGAKPTNDPGSSPALSLDRIRIEYGQAESVTISPVNKEEFIRNLQQRDASHA